LLSCHRRRTCPRTGRCFGKARSFHTCAQIVLAAAGVGATIRLLSPVPCPSLGSGYNFNRAHRRTGEANMRRAFIILLTSATLGISLPSTTPASAAPERFCAKWLYGASLQREAWGGWSYKYERLRCLKWVYLDIPQPNRFVPFFGFGAIPTDPSPWVTLNPQPLPPKARRANVR